MLEAPIAQESRPFVTGVWTGRAAWAAASALLGLHVFMLWRFAVGWPLHDDFTQILAVPGYLVQLKTFEEKFTLLIALALEHRAATVRLAGWLASVLPA